MGWELNKPNCCPLTCIAAAPHLHLGIIDSEHPAPGDTHICRHLHVSDVIGAGSRDVEVALSITGVKTCLGAQGQRAERHQHGDAERRGQRQGARQHEGRLRGTARHCHHPGSLDSSCIPSLRCYSPGQPQPFLALGSPRRGPGSQHPLTSPARRCGARGMFLPLKLRFSSVGAAGGLPTGQGVQSLPCLRPQNPRS